MSRRLIIPPISLASGQPLYEQIVQGFKTEISTGRLSAGAPLPSFRRLAEELLVSMITVKRAYEDLERAGLIDRRQGLGTFVAAQGENRSREDKLSRSQQLFTQGVKEAHEAGLTSRETMDLFRSILNPPTKP